jgi:long-chain fatty acid transport protein
VKQQQGLDTWAIGALLMTALSVQGGGLWMYERGTPDNMTAVAGRAASALDASTAAGNPAGMTLLTRPEVVQGLQPMYVDMRFSPDDRNTVSGDDGDQAGGLLPAGGIYVVYPLSDRLRLGWTNTSTYGAAMDFGDTFVGRYTVTNAELLTLGTGPSIGYRVNDWLSVGAGVYLTYAALSQDIAIPREEAGDGVATLEDDTFGYNATLGVLFHPRPGTRFGATYGTATHLKFKDALSVHGLGSEAKWLLGHLGLEGGEMDVEMVIPQGIMVSAYHELNGRWALLANVGWQDMSEAGQMDVRIRNAAGEKETTMDRRFRDTYHVALGVRCRLSEKWTWGCGVAYDTSPVDDEDRTIDMALDRQWRFATGVQYALSEQHTLGLSYTYVDLGSAPVDQSYPKARLSGEFDADCIHIVGLTWGMKF